MTKRDDGELWYEQLKSFLAAGHLVLELDASYDRPSDEQCYVVQSSSDERGVYLGLILECIPFWHAVAVREFIERGCRDAVTASLCILGAPSFESAWNVRKEQCVSWKDELQFTQVVTLYSPKCHCIWLHRRWIIHQCSLSLTKDETFQELIYKDLSFLNILNHRSSNNYWSWTHRVCLSQYLGLLPSNFVTSIFNSEIEYLSSYIRANKNDSGSLHYLQRLMSLAVKHGIHVDISDCLQYLIDHQSHSEIIFHFLRSMSVHKSSLVMRSCALIMNSYENKCQFSSEKARHYHEKYLAWRKTQTDLEQTKELKKQPDL